jgi:hypothetical protein
MRGKRWVLTAALVIAAIRMWQEVRGQAKEPWTEWAVGWGALFFLLAILSEVAEGPAAYLATLVVIGDLLQNGSSLFSDVNKVVSGSETGTLFPKLQIGGGGGNRAKTAPGSASNTPVTGASSGSNP